ncbi:hypothetical protein FVE85_2112 [Porphyridium purpureum]|uniref:Diphthine--ammonia ligase n=1 Tax=Porphyridium purpureum TaxID=35688 RepID=A0A5J4YZS4_PORPP|nr:hypothetical protein FVE85_2112 [Porphyridium purpureum]|eukprot:POR1748..scf209_3
MFSDDIEALHAAACASSASTYTDPESGYQVFTSSFLAKRGRCCGSGCRHCPFEHNAVPLQIRASRIQNAAFLYERNPCDVPGSAVAVPIKVLFWSGGKDSYLALRHVIRGYKEANVPFGTACRRVVLLTTFDVHTRRVSQQEVSIADIVTQARALDLDLLGVPLHVGASYAAAVHTGLRILSQCTRYSNVDALVFGDLHITYIREWREQHFGSEFAAAKYGKRYELQYPIFSQVPGSNYGTLMDELESSDVSVSICAVSGPLPAQSPLSVTPSSPPDKSDSYPPAASVTGPAPTQLGDFFTRELSARIAEAGWDAFGENGEFHTFVELGWTGASSAALLGFSEPAHAPKKN